MSMPCQIQRRLRQIRIYSSVRSKVSMFTLSFRFVTFWKILEKKIRQITIVYACCDLTKFFVTLFLLDSFLQVSWVS